MSDARNADYEGDPVPAPPGTFDELSPVELAALDIVMAAQGYRRVAGGPPSDGPVRS